MSIVKLILLTLTSTSITQSIAEDKMLWFLKYK